MRIRAGPGASVRDLIALLPLGTDAGGGVEVHDSAAVVEVVMACSFAGGCMQKECLASGARRFRPKHTQPAWRLPCGVFIPGLNGKFCGKD